MSDQQPPTINLAQNLALLRELHRNKRLEEARELCRRLLSLAPDSVEILYQSAMTELMAGRPDLSLPLLERAIVLNSRNAGCHRAHAAALKALGRVEEALAALERANALLSQPPASLDVRKVNGETVTHHLQHRPVNHVRFRKSATTETLLRAHLEGDPANVDDLCLVYALIDNVARTLSRGVPGALAAFGVHRGVGGRVIKTVAPGRMLYLIDTSEGGAPSDAEKTSDAEVIRCPGVFPGNAAALDGEHAFAVVLIDCPAAPTIRSGLEFFYPRLGPGALVIVRDYANDALPGVAEAVDGFLAGKPEAAVTIPDKSGTGMFVKAGPIP